MRSALRLLEVAIEMGRQELAHLDAGELARAEEVAFGRRGRLRSILSPTALVGTVSGELDAVIAKLEELKGLQARIIDSALRLRGNIGAEIRRVGREERRHKGYGQNTRPRRISSFYLNRQG